MLHEQVSWSDIGFRPEGIQRLERTVELNDKDLNHRRTICTFPVTISTGVLAFADFVHVSCNE
jgi:hypothetical protein